MRANAFPPLADQTLMHCRHRRESEIRSGDWDRAGRLHGCPTGSVGVGTQPGVMPGPSDALAGGSLLHFLIVSIWQSNLPQRWVDMLLKVKHEEG